MKKVMVYIFISIVIIISSPSNGYAVTGRYWVGGATRHNWNDTSPTWWSNLSGGANNQSVPTSFLPVTFSALSGSGGCVISADANCAAIDTSAYVGVGTVTQNSGVSLNISPSGTTVSPVILNTIKLNAYTATDDTSAINITSTATIAFIYGVTNLGNFTISCAGKETDLETAFSLRAPTTTLTLTDGTLKTNDYAVTTGLFSSSNSNTRALTLGASTVTVSGTGTVWDIGTSTGMTLTANTSTIKLSGNGTKTFNTGGFAYNNLTVTGTGTTTLSGAAVFNNINFGTDATISTSGTSNLTSVTTSAGGTGTLTLGGAATTTGDVGATGASLKEVDINNTGTNAFGGNVYAATFNFAADGTATIAGGKNLNGTVTTDTVLGGTGTLQYNGSTTIGGNIGTTGFGGKALKEVDFNGDTGLGYDIAATTTKVNAGTTTCSGNRTVTGALTNGAKLDIGAANLTVTGVYTQNAAAALNLAANSSSTFGTITTTASNASIANGSTINVTVNSYIPNNTTLAIINGAAGSTYGTAAINSNNPYVNFSGSGSGGVYTLTANRSGSNSFSGVASNSNSAAVGSVLDNVTSPSPDMTTVLNTLSSSSAGQVASSESTLNPTVDGAVTQSSAQILNQFVNNVVSRLETTRTTGGVTGISTGEGYLKGADIWAQGLGDYAHQDARGLSNGYNATTWGVSGGADMPVYNDSNRAGIGSGYGRTFVRSKDFCGHTDIGSIPAILYYSYQGANHPVYFDAAFTFIYNSYKGSRQVSVGSTIERTANADYNGQQYSGYFEGGYSFFYKKLSLTPLASFQYMHLHVGSYAETGADSLNLSVATQDYDMAQTGFGAKAAYPLDLKKYGTISRIAIRLARRCQLPWPGNISDILRRVDRGKRQDERMARRRIVGELVARAPREAVSFYINVNGSARIIETVK